jgi:hypothetical protein
MQWIKSHLNVVVAGSVSLLAIVALVLGVILPDPAKPMREDRSLLGRLQGTRGASSGAIDTLRRKQIENRKQLIKDMQEFEKGGGAEHKPLAPAVNIFPELKSGSQQAPFEFKSAYVDGQKKLIERLKAGDRPSQREIDEEASKMLIAKNQENFEQQKKQLGLAPAPTKPPVNNAGAVPVTPGLPMGGAPGMTGLPQLKADATPEERVALDPRARTSVSKAHRMLCYATVENLDQRPAITGQGSERPRLDDMWYAQMALWVQEDVLGALADLNQQVAAQLPQDQQWVGNMPFKRLLSFRVGGYVPSATPQAGGGTMPSLGGGPAASGGPPMDANAVMTKHGSNEAVDVIQFSIEMIVEAQALPQIIEKICSAGFYTILQISYEAVPPNNELFDYIYGSKPVINVSMLLEGSFLRNKYDKWMPTTVKGDIKAGKAVGGGAAGGTTNVPSLGSGAPMGLPPGVGPPRRGMPEGPRSRGRE